MVTDRRPRVGRTRVLLTLAAALCLGGSAAWAEDRLPAGFSRSAAVWGGIGGPEQGACESLAHYPVVLVHGDGDGPEVWFEGPAGGLAGALRAGGLAACEVWALRIGEDGVPLRSLEELTDDVKSFVQDVLRHTGAQRVQLVGHGSGAVLIHATLVKYHLHDQVHAVAYLDGPFAGIEGCDGDRCLSGEVRCCALRPGSGFLERALQPHETPKAHLADPDRGAMGHLDYLALGSTPAVALQDRSPEHGGWMLDGASNVQMPALANAGGLTDPAVSGLLLRFLSTLAEECSEKHDEDGDGFCGRMYGGTDCEDGNPAIHPLAAEIPEDGIDQDCNRHDLVPSMPGWRCEQPLHGGPPEGGRDGPLGEGPRGGGPKGGPPPEGGPPDGGPPGGGPPGGKPPQDTPGGAAGGANPRLATLLICLVGGLGAGLIAWYWRRLTRRKDEEDAGKV